MLFAMGENSEVENWKESRMLNHIKMSRNERIVGRCIISVWLRFEHSSNKNLLWRLLDKRVVVPQSAVEQIDFIGAAMRGKENYTRGSSSWRTVVESISVLKQRACIVHPKYSINLDQIATLDSAFTPCSAVIDYMAITSSPDNLCLPTSFMYHFLRSRYKATVQHQ